MRKLRRRFSIAFALIFTVGLMAPAIADARMGQPRVQICHKGQVIEVSAIAALFHVLVHGDTIGSCTPQPPTSGSGV